MPCSLCHGVRSLLKDGLMPEASYMYRKHRSMRYLTPARVTRSKRPYIFYKHAKPPGWRKNIEEGYAQIFELPNHGFTSRKAIELINRFNPIRENI